jgi:uncharacterized membrane protein
VTVAKETSVTINRNERVIAYMIAAIVGLSILAFLSIIIGTAVGLDQAAFTSGIWPAVYVLPEIGLPIGFVLIIVLLILSARRRAREARAAEEQAEAQAQAAAASRARPPVKARRKK